ncbi:MAG: hypothetical protein OS130_14330 [Thermodesulfobacteriota bacterium]|nr:MAG: hypothetical protein OS130_14330 [Thermodesulfobacteriota bacterium]
MKRNKIILFAICLIFLMTFITSCTSSNPRRAPLVITPYSQQLSVIGVDDITILFEEVIPGKPLNETVWDNAVGPFWDVKESSQIGFTPDSSRSWPVRFSVGVAGGSGGHTSTGGGVGVTTSPKLTKTRIIIPFGNIFSRIFESAIKTNIKHYTTCYTPTCASQSSVQNTLKIKIINVSVWEEPINHLNLTIHGNSAFLKNGKVVKDYEFTKPLLTQNLGTSASSPNTFINEMNRISNILAQDASTDIINNTLK